MQIVLSRTTDEQNKVDKALTTVSTIDIDILATASMGAFSFTLSGAPLDVNYMHIPAWGRYYFVDDPVVLRNGRTGYNAHVDVLMTYKAQFRQDSGIIARQENEGNLYINDNNFPIENKNDVWFKEFPSGFDIGLSYYLTIGG